MLIFLQEFDVVSYNFDIHAIILFQLQYQTTVMEPFILPFYSYHLDKSIKFSHYQIIYASLNNDAYNIRLIIMNLVLNFGIIKNSVELKLP